MAEYAEGLIRRSKKLCTVGLGAVAVSAALLSFGAGSAAADEIKGDPTTPSQGPVVEGGVRPGGVTGDVRAADKGVVSAQGNDVRGSNIAVPTVKGDSPSPGNLSAGLDECLFQWAGC